ncbi:DUF4381 domain-containing protein [Lacimicrobium sp. SS2-24]|uniref:DUF4381 domain-containing protein n=1 Tax=Lacimicrobium sp. SS2-24 TaxID=2005569 RepID=UPI000B4ADC6F|nr:DUF4381 domain-containing protein [Lacimicrobium sp. SS2-24]
MNTPATAQLRDIHLPETVGWWPPAPGWWLLALFLIVIVILIARWQLRAYRYRCAIRQALQELEQISAEQPNWPQHLNSLLKRLALSYFPREQTASLHQQQWLDFLVERLPKAKQSDFADRYQLLLNSLYQRQPSELDIKLYKTLAKDWIRRALPPAKKEASHV